MPALDRPTETAVDELARRARAAGLAPHAAEALALDCVLALRAQGWRPTAARAAEERRALTPERYRFTDEWLAEAPAEPAQAPAAEALALDCVLALRAQGWRPTAARAAEERRALTHERYRFIDEWLAEARAELDQARAAEVRSPLDQARAAAEVRALLDQITHRTRDHR